MSVASPDLSELTQLQRAAVERIQEYQAELQKYGLYVRSSVELEFNVEDKDGKPAEFSLNRHQAKVFLQKHLPFIEDFHFENHNPILPNLSNLAQYEVNVANVDKTDPKLAPTEFSPVKVASVVNQLKKHTLADMLRETTCLTPEYEYTKLQPNFTAMPYHNLTTDHSQVIINTTSGMHINVSLYNEKGENLFASRSHTLWEHCADSLLNIQHLAGLSLLPNDNSHLRVTVGAENNHSTPVGIGLRYTKSGTNAHERESRVGDTSGETPLRSEPDYNSLLLRERGMFNDERHLENRLPGADADPFVAMAVTMAGLVDAVRKHVKPTTPEDKSTLRYDSDDKAFIVGIRRVYDFEDYDLPKTVGKATDRLAKSRQMHDLLGDKLYSAILQEYGAKGASR